VARASAAAAGRSAVPPLVPTQLARRLAFETLESRVLMSADAPAALFSDVLAATPAPQGAEFRAIAAPVHAPIVIAYAAPPLPTPAAPRATELAIIDAAVPDHDRLMERLQADAASRGHALEVVLVAPGRDGIDAISAALAGRSGLDAVHVVSHGASGEVRLGATRLDAAALAAEADQVRAWGQALGPDGDLLLYGCEVASAMEGRALVDMLALLTAADVAASDDRTGHAALGGDWDLEYVAGAVESAPGANAAMASWQGVLAATFYLGGDTSPPFSDLESAPPTDSVWNADNNYDPARDAQPGLVIAKDNESASQSDPTKQHTWTVAAPTGGLVIAGDPVTLTLWMAMKDFETNKQGAATAYLLDLATATSTSGTLIAQATMPRKYFPSAFSEETIDFGFVTHTVAAGRHLGVKVVVNNDSADDVWFAYDATAYPSRLQIGAPNQPPAAADDAYAMTEDTALVVAGKGVLGNDTDVDSPVLSAVLVTGPARGTLALAADGSFTYTPAPDFFGVDGFTYLASDGATMSNVATVTIAVANAVDTTVVVNTTADAADGDTSSIDALLANRGGDGVVSLREAILAANATPNGATPDRIHFDIPGAGPHVIGVLTTLPSISDAVVIDATTEPGYAGAPLVQLDGGGGAGSGLRLASGGSTVRGLAITGFGQSGILVSSAGNRIQGNHIGVDATGSTAGANGQYGVRLMAGGNLVGGAAVGDRNVISGNLIDGVHVGGGSGNVVQGNYIGTDAAGMTALANGEDGVWINGATDTLVTGNLLSGNGWTGVATTGSGAGTRILANVIGLDAAGTGTLANQRQGVLLGGFDAVQVGGTAAGEGNRIAGNLLDGVAVAAGTGHSILGNAIHDNGGLGIDLGDDGVTVAGVPQIAYASSDGTVAGTLAAAPATTYRIELFASPGPDPTGYGEGRRYLGYTTVATDAAGNASFTASVAPFAAGEIVTGTATDLASGATSEFGAGVSATPPNTAPGSADAAVTLGEDTTRAFTVADFPFADADLGDSLGGVRIDTLPGSGLLTLGGVAVTAGQFIAAADIAAGLLVYAPVPEASGAPYAAFTFAVRDSGVPPAFAAAARTMTLNVLPVNDPPGLGALAGDARAYAEGAALTPVDAGGDATVGDVDSPDFDGGALTVGIVSGGDAAEDVLAIRHQGFGAGQIGVSGATVSFGGVAIGSVSGGSGGADLVVALNGNATPAAVQALVRNVGYRNTDLDAPTPGARSVRFVVADGDGGASAAAVATITVGAVNDAPTASIAAASYAATENVPLVLSGTGIAVGDVDAASGVITATLSVVSGTLVAAPGTTGVTVTGGGAAITLTGTLAQVNALLAGAGGSITYVMGSDSPPASDTLALAVNDNGNTGTGGARTAGDTAIVAIVAVNDAPVNTLPGTAMTAEDTPLVFAAGQVAITDVDAGAAGVQVTLGVTSGTLTLGGIAGLAFAVGDGVADTGMVFTGTVSAVNVALAGLVFTPVPDSVLPAVITLSTDDLGNTGSGGALADLNDTITVVIVGTNDAPSASGGTVTTPRNVPYALRVADFGFADPDAGDTLGAVRIDALPALGSLTLSGAAVGAGQTVAAADIAAGGLVFTPGLDGTGMPYTSFAYTVADAGGLYAAAVATLVIDIANTPPSGVDGTALTFEGVAYTLAAADFGFADVDAGDALSAVRIDVPPALGTLTLAGTPVAPGDVVAVADIAAGLLVYTPPVVGTGSPFAGIAFSVRDSYGPDFDPTPAALAIDVVAGTAAPVNVVPGMQTVNEDTSTPIAGIAVADVNGDLATVSLAAANGTVTVSLAGGASISAGTNGGAAVTLFGTQAQLNAALATLVYRGNADFTGADAITLVSSDATLLTAASTIPVTVSAVNDAPTAAITPASYAADEGVPLALAGTGLAVGDVDSSSVTVTLSVLSGTLSVTGAGVTIAGSGSAVVVLTGAVADVNALLTGGGTVTYLMGSDAPPASDTLRLQIDDGAGGSAFDVATITVAPVNDAPVNTLPGAVSTLEDTAIVFAGATRIAVTDVDVGGAAVQVSLTASRGVLDLSGTAGLAFLAGDGTGDATMTFSGTLAAVNAALDGLRYTPTLHYNGLAFLSITSSDLGANGAGGVRTDSDSTTLSIAPVNDAPGGTDATLLATEDVGYVLSAASFGFVDVDAGDSLAAVRIDAVTLPAGAALRLSGVDIAPGDVVDAADLAAGRLVFTAAADANGAAYASLRFSVRDAGGPAFDPVPNALVFDVAAVNDAPVITSNGGGAAAAVTAVENGTPVLATVTAADVDSAPAGFTYAIAGGADAARFLVDAVTGELRFAAAPNFEAPADAGADNVYDVVVSIADGDGGFDTQAIAVGVTDADDAPVAADDAYAAFEDVPLVIAAAGVLGNDLDEDGSPLAATLVSGPASGTVTLDANGSFTYTPNANFVGTDAFRYRVSDGALVSGVATVVISVAPENVAPTAGGGGFSVDAGLAYVFGIGDFGYADQDGDPLAAVTITALPDVGELRLAGVAVVVGQQIDAADIAAGRLQYVTPSAAPAVTSFGFVVSDGTATSASAGTITVGITAVPVPAPAADPGGGGGPSAPPPAEAAPTPSARPGPARGETLAGEAPAGGGRASGGAGGGEGGESAAVQAQAQNAPAAPAAAAAGVAAPTAAAALSSSGASAGLALVAPREAGLGGVEVRDGSAHEQDVAAAAVRAVQAIEAIAAPEFRGELDRLREEQAQEATVTTRVAGSVMVVTSGLSVGYVLWLLRGGVLLASLLTSLPAWRLVDPLPVLAHMGGDDEDDDSLQDMVEGGGKPRTEATARARTDAPASMEQS
jgi:CSLREA domain-containing protein